jgi:hypothetical protein
MHLDAPVAKIPRQGRIEDQCGEFAVTIEQVSQIDKMRVAAAVKGIHGDKQYGSLFVLQWFLRRFIGAARFR